MPLAVIYMARGVFYSHIYALQKLLYYSATKGGNKMPKIKSSTDLRNHYNEISTFCHKHQEPIFITKNGQGDLAVMSIDLYETINNKLELYVQLAEGRAAVNEGRKRSLEEIMAFEKKYNKYELYHLLDEALEAEKAGDHMDYREFMAEFRREPS